MPALCVSSAGKEDKEMNEFYEVVMTDGPHFFKSKDKAFSFLWQEFLNACGDLSDEALDDAKFELFNWYSIEGFGEVVVRGFED